MTARRRQLEEDIAAVEKLQPTDTSGKAQSMYGLERFGFRAVKRVSVDRSETCAADNTVVENNIRAVRLQIQSLVHAESEQCVGRALELAKDVDCGDARDYPGNDSDAKEPAQSVRTLSTSETRHGISQKGAEDGGSKDPSRDKATVALRAKSHTTTATKFCTKEYV